MKSSEKFKLCPSCDGKAPLEVVICPFCAQSFNELTKTKSTLSASYTPPYSVDRSSQNTQEATPLKESATKTQTLKIEKSLFLPVALLTIGSNLLILAFLLLILNHDGKVELEWSASYWMIYALLGLPLLFMGYKILKKED
jgi:hypothetical protein